MIEVPEFAECAICAAKPGSPTLCPACLHNRATINQLRTEREELIKASLARVKKIARDARHIAAYDDPPYWRPVVAELANEVAKILVLIQRPAPRRRKKPCLSG